MHMITELCLLARYHMDQCSVDHKSVVGGSEAAPNNTLQSSRTVNVCDLLMLIEE